jgi:hypothetical protein
MFSGLPLKADFRDRAGRARAADREFKEAIARDEEFCKLLLNSRAGNVSSNPTAGSNHDFENRTTYRFQLIKGLLYPTSTASMGQRCPG